MNRLHDIMGSLSEVSMGLESLLCVLVSLEEDFELTYDYTAQKTTHVIRLLLELMSEKLSDSIDEIDRFIIDDTKE